MTYTANLNPGESKRLKLPESYSILGWTRRQACRSRTGGEVLTLVLGMRHRMRDFSC